MAELTPMMKQYLEIKKDNPDSILFFRLGDFYEMFADDAKLASRELDLTLTSRDHGKHAKPEEERVPMCGIPYHASEAYIARLIAKGYKVAICEQMEDPATAKGLVKRDIIRVVTPGTVIDSSMLDESRNNFICAVCMDDSGAALARCDISTGEFVTVPFSGKGYLTHLLNRLSAFGPREALLSERAWEEQALTDFLKDKLECRCERGSEADFAPEAAAAALHACGLYDRETFAPDLSRETLLCYRAAGALTAYLQKTQKTDLGHLGPLVVDREGGGEYMELDLTARRNLELTETLRGKEKKGSLLWVLDKTRTAMGHRLIRAWLEQPLKSPVAIAARQEAVAALVDDTVAREEISLSLRSVPDLERLMGRVVYGSANARDLKALGEGLGVLPELREQVKNLPGRQLSALTAGLDDLPELRETIAAAICDEPPFTIREAGFIRDGYDAEVDRLRGILHGGKGFIADIEAREKEKTGIKSLKVGYNKVFGYYIEVSKSYYDQVPETYIRKQTLANCERYITQELKDLEHTVLTANDRLAALEYQIFCDLRQKVSAQVRRVQSAAAAVAELDVLTSFAQVAEKNNYCRPDLDESDVIEIHDGRHPVVEQMLKDSLFVPNDTFMGAKEDRVAIITGPNMAGKSTYMRQVALIVLMAQVGSFVPAKSAHIGVVDRIFTRIGASDDLSAGQSTFMVEMTEVADILRQATRRSLLILDEIGRGTSTFDGMSIARAVLEYCADRKMLGAKTLFATHYHELTELEGSLPGVVNYNIAVKTRGEDIVFLRKILPGGADRSYGIEVAKLAGLPDRVLARAREILTELEAENGVQYVPARQDKEQVSLDAMAEGEVLDALRRCQPDTLTPIEAMSLLYELKQKLR